MAEPLTLERARAAKALLKERLGTLPWVRGIGLARDGASWVLRLNVARSALRAADVVPTEIDGVPIQVVYLEGYEPRKR